MAKHSEATGTVNIHVPYAWSYADAAARTGATGFVAGDLGKLSRQLDTNTLWMLTATTPTWVQVGAAGAGGGLAAANNLSDVANAATARTNIGFTDANLSTSDVTTNNVVSTKHGFAPKSPADAATFLNGAATPAYAAVKDSDLATTDITTNNVSTTKHGFAPKLSNVATEFLDGTGAYSVPAGGGGGTTNLARFTRTTTQAIANNTVTIVDFATSEYDTGSRVTTGAAWKYTANATGYYRVAVAALFDTTAGWADTEVYSLAIYKNGALYATLYDNRSNGGAQFVGGGGSTTLALTNTDYIDIRVFQNSGGSLNLIANGTYNHVAIEQIA